MKKVFKILLAQVLILVCCVQAFAENYDDFFYVQSNETGDYELYVFGNKNELVGDIVIPSQLDFDGELVSVTRIGYGAFLKCNGITSITIPNTVTVIGPMAFAGCSGLTSVTIPNTVTTISDGAFNQCTGLTSISIPNSVTTIGDGAFMKCTGLTSIEIPESVTYMYRSFSGCSNLSSVTIKGSSTGIDDTFADCPISEIYMPEDWEISYYSNLYIEKDGIRYMVYNGKEVMVTKSNYSGTVTLPNTITAGNTFSVTSVEYDAFVDNSEIRSLILSDNVTSVACPFTNCPNFQFNEYDNGLYIGTATNPYKFLIKAKSTDITSIKLHDDCERVPFSAFDSCDELTSIEIPKSVTDIKIPALKKLTELHVSEDNERYSVIDNVLYNKDATVLERCPPAKLGAFVIPNSVTTIADWAFEYCDKITSVEIPEGVTTIGLAAFDGCVALTSIVMPNSVTKIGGSLFQDCSALESVKLSENLTDLDYYLFNGCTSLTSVTIPEKVTTMYHTFLDCTNLRNIEILSPSIKEMYSIMYSSCYSLETISIPENSVNYVSIDGIIYEKNEDGTPIEMIVCPQKKTGTVVIADGCKHISYCLQNCTKITSVTIPASLSDMYISAFNGCTSLKSVIVSEDNKNFIMQDGVLYRVADDGMLYDIWVTPKNTAVEDVQKSLNVKVSNGQILVNGEAPAFVVTVAGQKIANANLKAGVYFVVADGKTVGVSVR